MRENFFKLEADLAVTKQFNNVLCDQMVQVKRKSCSNEQYSRGECLEIVAIPETVSNSSLEETALNIFKWLGVSISPSDKALSPKKIIIKMSRQKDAVCNMWKKSKVYETRISCYFHAIALNLLLAVYLYYYFSLHPLTFCFSNYFKIRKKN